ncbi:Fanconi anemia group J protein homolog [Prorops nasuta]|uniref:Fanconi anemia group J protein homolog n=1 Tax=Prorops nasuta TaxID=863751 RepID=UPI0034CFB645
MILLCIITSAIVTFIYSLIKVKLEELETPAEMKRNRLQRKSSADTKVYKEKQDTSCIVISDDESDKDHNVRQVSSTSKSAPSFNPSYNISDSDDSCFNYIITDVLEGSENIQISSCKVDNSQNNETKGELPVTLKTPHGKKVEPKKRMSLFPWDKRITMNCKTEFGIDLSDSEEADTYDKDKEQISRANVEKEDNSINKLNSIVPVNWRHPFFVDTDSATSSDEGSEIRLKKKLKLKDNFIQTSDSSTMKQESTSNIENNSLKDKLKMLVDHGTSSISHMESEEDKVALQYGITMAGIKVILPVKPYPCQVAVMNALIKGCKSEKNCLLESPTGSGKTLALLCGVLAWQQDFKDEMRAQFEEQCGDSDNPYKFHYDYGKEPDAYPVKSAWDEMKEPIPVKVPTIFYGTRTHKQIEQVIRELRKTSYRDINMTILSSREHTCIKETFNRTKTELCAELLDPGKKLGCPFYNEKTRKIISSNSALNAFNISRPWDVEEFVQLGRQNGACPYFAARDLMMQAYIVFCPYNYILDPFIRETMQINLKGTVIILDEAHNIEDICRSVASNDFRDEELEVISAECDKLASVRASDATVYKTIGNYLQSLINFFKTVGKQKIDRDAEDMISDYWVGNEFIEILSINGIQKSRHENFLKAVHEAIQHYTAAREQMKEKSFLPDDQEKKGEAIQPTISETVRRTLETLAFSFEYIMKKEYANDFKACVRLSITKKKYLPENTWTSRGAKNQILILQVHCMNSAVIFKPISDTARSIVLASGTLAPTMSFQSELGTEFAYNLNANHVIPKDQIYATCIPRGPTGYSIKATYNNVNTWNFQDELGRIVVDVCETVPHGVLCFFSSYSVMNNHIVRWRKSTFWQDMEKVKYIFEEPRYSNDLAEMMSEFRACIEETANGPRHGKTGALMLAVFRGKVSEGIDFKDNEARCLISVGIPFAVRKDPTVDMKFIYNDLNAESKGLLSGIEWYKVQAYRALNQALGRCVRHINDWGAVLLVDERFQQESSIKYLPKWIKSLWTQSTGYNIKKELSEFVSRQKKRDQLNTSF